jgi:hypothetical protein
MKIRVTSVGNTEDGGWMIEFTRVVEEPFNRHLTVVVSLPREEGKDPPGLDTAINAAAGIARSYFEAMHSFNELAGAHDG